jgi:hypothetical protein
LDIDGLQNFGALFIERKFCVNALIVDVQVNGIGRGRTIRFRFAIIWGVCLSELA